MAWRPEPGQVVLLELEDGGPPVTGIVTAASSPGPVHIDVTGGGRPVAVTGPVRAIVFAPDAVYEVTGRTPGVVRGAVELAVEHVERIQRRRLPRRRRALPVTLSAFEDAPAGYESVRGETIDVGPGGCRVATRGRFPAGAEATLVIRMPQGPPVVTAAAVLDQHGLPGGGHEYRLVFTGLAPLDAHRLASL